MSAGLETVHKVQCNNDYHTNMHFSSCINIHTNLHYTITTMTHLVMAIFRKTWIKWFTISFLALLVAEDKWHMGILLAGSHTCHQVNSVKALKESKYEPQKVAKHVAWSFLHPSTKGSSAPPPILGFQCQYTDTSTDTNCAYAHINKYTNLPQIL